MVLPLVNAVLYRVPKLLPLPEAAHLPQSSPRLQPRRRRDVSDDKKLHRLNNRPELCACDKRTVRTFQTAVMKKNKSEIDKNNSVPGNTVAERAGSEPLRRKRRSKSRWKMRWMMMWTRRK
jgi:hypothetical protein